MINVIDRTRRQGEGSPSRSSGVSSPNQQNNLPRNESFVKALGEKDPKSVSFKMPDSDEIELVEKGKKGIKNATSNGKANRKDVDLASSKDITIDFVLVYEEKTDLDEDDQEKEKEHEEKRQFFESSLQKKGLFLQHVNSDLNEKYNKVFVLIHAPWPVLEKCAEEMMIRVPVKEPSPPCEPVGWNRIYQKLHNMITVFHHQTWGEKKEKHNVNAFFNKDKQHLFLNSDDKANFFSEIDRSRMVSRLLDGAHFSSQLDDFGINRLLYENTYMAAYPLHQGTSELPESIQPSTLSRRQGLKYSWASFSQWYKFQPLNAIKDYFGVRVSMYFAWLGVYNYMLVAASFVGLLCFFTGLFSIENFIPAKEICDKNNSKLFYMCPLCDVDCSYWSLTVSCRYARLTHLFDHEGTVFFAAFMALWAAVFLEFWKRKQISLAFEWDMMYFEEEFEPMRPSFVAASAGREKRPNPINGMLEPYIPYSTQLLRQTCSMALVAFMVSLVIAAVAGVVLYRAAVSAALYAYPNEAVQRGARIITSITASTLNLLTITILSYVYDKIALFLTNWENPRTDTEFTNSLTLKMFLFQSVNMYSSLFYIAFFKSSMIVGVPGRFNRIGGGRMEGCDPSGCLIELCIQLAIILVGKQLIQLVIKFVIPCLTRWWNRKQQKDLLENGELDQWEKDYLLNSEPEFRMFYEYHDIVIQYGFVTMFVAAFPLAPFFALCNNILELRIDAINFVVNFRRPVAQRARNIGSWLGILQIMSQIAIIVNSFVIAFTSEFIPRLVYQYVYSPDGTLKGYVNDSLSYFNVSDFEPQSVPARVRANLDYNFTHCRYKEYFESKYPYRYDRQFFYVLAVRLAFVLIFQYLVFFIAKFLDYVIPDTPYHLEINIKRENYISKKCLTKGGVTVTRDFDGESQASSSYLSCEENLQMKNRGHQLAAENEV